MKKTVLKYGLISAAILETLVLIVTPLNHNGTIPFEYGAVAGYTAMVLAFIVIFYGVRSYRDNVGGGTVTFVRAFQVGILITLITCAAYVITWEIYYFNWGQDFIPRYIASMLENMRANGATPAEIAAKAREMAEFAKLYENPLVNIGMTLLEVFPVGLVMTLIAAAILRRKSATAETMATAAA
jgi:uncharacterized protein DUF4199